MLTLLQMQKILLEKDREKQKEMIDSLSEEDRNKLLTDAEKLANEGRNLIEKWRKK